MAPVDSVARHQMQCDEPPAPGAGAVMRTVTLFPLTDGAPSVGPSGSMSTVALEMVAPSFIALHLVKSNDRSGAAPVPITHVPDDFL